MHLRRAFAAFLFAPILLTGCAALASLVGVAAPAVGSALGAYARAADDAQRAAGLPSTDPEVVALRSMLAALEAAQKKEAAAREPVECIEPVPVGAPKPAPAVNVDALALALQDVAASNRAVVEALTRVKAKRPRKAPAVPADVAPVDAGADQ